MDKNRKSIVFVTIIGMLCLVMIFVYINFLNDQPLIQAQQRQGQQQPVLTPEQMANGVKDFIQTTTSNIKPPPGGLP